MEGHTNMTDWTTLKYVVVDVEGNGQQPSDLVELAAVPVVAGIIGEARSWLVRPDQPITHFARRIHGITNEQVAEAPVFADIKDEVLSALDGSALIAHNAHIDVDVLQRKLDGGSAPRYSTRSNLPAGCYPTRMATSLAPWSRHSSWLTGCAQISRRTARRTTCW